MVIIYLNIKKINDIKNNQNRSISILNKKVQELSMKIAKLKSLNNVHVITNFHPSNIKDRSNSLHCSTTSLAKKNVNNIRYDKYHRTMYSSSSSKSINNIRKKINKSLNFNNDIGNSIKRSNVLLQNFSTTNQSSFISSKDTLDNKNKRNVFKKLYHKKENKSNNINNSYIKKVNKTNKVSTKRKF